MKPLVAFLLLLSASFAEDRPGRLIFFHASWCTPCVEALEGPQQFPDWLRASGWKVGVGTENHVQLVDIDRRDDLKTIYHVESVPSMVVVGGDGTVHPYTGRKSMIDLLPTASVSTGKPGQHSHLCTNCGTEWWHGDSSLGSVPAHRCPNCGVIEWRKHQQGTLQSIDRKVSLPVFRTRANCPTGNCPLR